MKEILFYKEGKINYPSFFSEKLICDWIDVIAEHYSKSIGSLSFILCDDEYILSVNQQFLNHDYYTDVITFDYCEEDLLSGDIFISLDTVKSNSDKFQTDFVNEFNRVVCHSILHLIGFKDKTNEESMEMRDNEDNCLKLLKELKNK